MQQPEISSSYLALSPAPLPGAGPDPEGDHPSGFSPRSELGAAQPDPHSPQRIPNWLVHLELFLRVILCVCLGLILCFAPWWDLLRPVWEKSLIFELYPPLAALPLLLWVQNPLFTSVPALGAFAMNGAVRGIVSGLGILNLWIALHDVRHRDD